MKKALTIGELLITMTIIGIIAILVIPGFIKDYHNKLYTSKIKKIYGTISSALEQSCSDSEVSYFYQTSYSELNNATAQLEFLNKYLKVIPNNTQTFASTYSSIDKKENSSITVSNAKVRLKSGESIALSCTTAGECEFIIDINSTDEPNTGGRDLFVFKINTLKNELSPSSATCGTDNLGSGCFESIIYNNWEMKY